MQDRPNMNELTEAVREFLEVEILPTVSDARLKFRVLIAMNALGMIGREAELEESNLQAEFSSLNALLKSEELMPESFSSLKAGTLELNRNLAHQIRLGDIPEGIFDRLEMITRAKLAITNPSYLKRYE
jgi:hypothetical protein